MVKPIEQADITEINKVFSRFNRAYEESYKRYARRKDMTDISWHSLPFKEIVKLPMVSGESYQYPDFMREFLGYGIVQSYITVPEQGKKAYEIASKKAEQNPQGAQKKRQTYSSKVGAALSVFHTMLRNAGKEWGTLFDANAISTQLLRPEARKKILASGKTEGQWVDEFKSILEWAEDSDRQAMIAMMKNEEGFKNKPLPDNIKSSSKPACLEGMSDKAICNDMLERFAALEKIPLTQGRLIPNSMVHVERHESSEVDSWLVKYDVPAAAIAWGIRPAGMAILGRPEQSPLRLFLEHVVGVADEAGRKMAELAYGVFNQAGIEANYDRAGIKKSLQDQKYWIKAAAIAEKILGHEQMYQAYEDVLSLIGEDAMDINFSSANKTAVLLYTATERLQKAQEIAQKENQHLHEPGDGMALADVLAKVRECSVALAKTGIQTEKELENAKYDNHAKKDPHAYYTQESHRIFESQTLRVREIFMQNPEYSAALMKMARYASALNKMERLDEDTMHCIETAVDFCKQHIKQPSMSAQRLSGRTMD